MKVTAITTITGVPGTVTKGLIKGLEDKIIRTGKNTEMSPGNLRCLAVTQTPVRNHHLKLVRKTFNDNNNNNYYHYYYYLKLYN